MKVFCILLLSLLAGCGTLSQPIRESDRVLEQRLQQIEDATRRLKSESIAEARDAAADLVAKARTELEDAGKGVILLAANELDAKLEKRLEQVNEILEQRVNQIADRADATINRQKDDGLEIVKKLMRDEVPGMVEASVMRSADRLIERLGGVKSTTIGPDGVPVEVWALGGSGLLGTLWNLYRIWSNKRKGLKRLSEDDVNECVDARIAQVIPTNGSIPTVAPGPTPTSTSGSGIVWSVSS